VTRSRRRVALATALAGVIAAISIALADPGSPLAVTKIDTPDPVASGAELTYTITIVNTGGAKVTNVVLSDQLNGVGGIGSPPQLVLTSTRGSCQQNVNLVTCNAGSIEGLGTWVVTIRGMVTASNGTTINNTVSVSGTKSAQNFTTTASASTLVSGGGGSPLPDLTIAKTGPTSVVKSSPMTYTLTVNNLGTANATNIKVSDTLPPGLTGVTQTGTSLFGCSNDGGAPQVTVTCIGGAVNQGSNATITINATAPSTTTPATITNTAAVDPDNTIVEGNELNNSSALVNTAVVDASSGGLLTIDKTDKDAAPAWDDLAGPDPVNPGQVITYKILVTNPTVNRADDVVIVDGTQGLQAASIQVSQIVTNGSIGTFGGCTVAAPQAKCSIKSLNAGGTIVMTVSGQVVASAGSSIINTATVTANIKNAGTTSTDTELTTVKPAIDLTVTKADSPDPVCARSWPTSALGGGGGSKPAPTSPPELAAPVCLGGLTYTFVIGNSGNTIANNVVLRDPLPAGLIFDHATGTAGVFSGGCSWDQPSNVVTCTGGTLNPDTTKTITFVMVAPAGVGSISNTVTIDPANAIFEADETNNTATQTTQVATGIDLTILKQDAGNNFITGTALPGFDPIARSGTQTYTILVDNIGPQDASNIMVSDTLPANTTLRSASGDHGFTCSQTGQIVNCVGGSIKGTESEFYAGNLEDHATISIKLFAQSAVGTMHNEVTVDPLNQIAEINENNNFDVEDTKVQNGAPGAFNDLTIVKTPKNTTVKPNDEITYNLKITNIGSDPAVDVAVRDILPATVTFISAKDVSGGPATAKFSCSAAAGIVDCTGATIAGTDATLLPGVPSERNIEIKVKAPNHQGPVFNQAFVDPDNAIPEGDELNNTDSATTTVSSVINLAITKTGPNSSSQSQVTDYVITLENQPLAADSGQTAFDVDMHDPLPVGLIPLAVDTGTGNNWQCQVGENPINVVDCVGDLEPNFHKFDASKPDKTVTIKITVFMTAENKRSLDNEACVDTLLKIEEFDPPGEGDNCSTHSTLLTGKPKLSPDILISKNVDKTLASAGENLKYTIVVANAGTAKAKTLVKVTDTLPNTVMLVGTPVTTDNWTCDTTALPTVTCQDDGSGLDVGASITITMNVTISDNVTTPIANTAEEVGTAVVDPGSDPNVDYVDEVNNGNNTSTVVTSISSAPFDLLIAAITDSPDPVTVGQPLKYTVTAANAGTQDAPNVFIRVTMPPATDATFVSADGSNGFNCSALGAVFPNSIDCTAANMPAGGTTTITVNLTPTAPPPADLTLTAKIDVDDVFKNETDEGNNTQSETTTVSGTVCVNCVDLVASQLVATPDPANLGGAVVFKFVVVNVGDTPTTLDPDNAGQPLASLDLAAAGLFSYTAFTSSDPTITCKPAPVLPAPLIQHRELNCFGNLGPGKGVILSVTASALAASSITAVGTVDPNSLIAEPFPNGENNNQLSQSVVIK
jgi:uncharacterized repeat protein (TIGR01451 family)